MPVIIPQALPAVKELENESIFLMDDSRARTQDIRPLKIAIVNLMPKKIETETQLLRLLSNSALQLDIDFITTKSYVGTNTPLSHLNKFYVTLDCIKNDYYDGIIITGAPVEHLDFEDVAYWDELTEILDFSRSNCYSALYICWASQAALYYFYGIKKYNTKKKIFGIYPHKKVNYSSIIRGFDDIFYIPQSRHTENKLEDIQKNENLKVIATSDLSGLCISSSIDDREIFIAGHVEYDKYTLKDEYIRDINKKEDIAIPFNYFPNNDITKEPIQNWRSQAHLLFSNWLNYHVYQTTPFNLDNINKLKKH